jgi:DNA invertase Pin-like site-specific DNA recombinase
MAKIGYGRVSSSSQDLAIQISQLEKAGCSPIRTEKVSGKSRDGRTELESILEFVRAGDELIVCKLDRLGRSTRDVLNIVHELEAKGASLKVLEPELSTSGDVGRIVVTVLGMVAELERKFIRERQQAGIEAAKVKGIYKGRKRSVDASELEKLVEEGVRPSEIAKRLKKSRMTIYREIKLLKAKKASAI